MTENTFRFSLGFKIYSTILFLITIPFFYYGILMVPELQRNPYNLYGYFILFAVIWIWVQDKFFDSIEKKMKCKNPNCTFEKSLNGLFVKGLIDYDKNGGLRLSALGEWYIKQK